MFVLSSISSSFGFWSLSHTSKCENFESNVLNNIKYLDKMSDN